jgi:hypothetical protein
MKAILGFSILACAVCGILVGTNVIRIRNEWRSVGVCLVSLVAECVLLGILLTQ